MEEENVKIEPEEAILAEQSTKPTQNKVSSEYFAAYAAEMDKVRQRCEDKAVVFGDISFRQDCYEPFGCKIVKESNHFEIILMEVRIGGFSLNLKMLNIDQKSPLSSCEEAGRGKFGKVHTFYFKDKEVAVKSRQFRNEAQQDQTTQLFQQKCQQGGGDEQNRLVHNSRVIKEVIRQYSIMKIVDRIGHGVKVENPFGFDLIVFEDCLQFAMEKCEPIHSYSEANYGDLLETMGQMHRHHIIHKDVNPNNIMFSLSRQKPVFVDFGFSDIVPEECGVKTWTFFQGTLSYVYSEMSKMMYLRRQMDFIDLYYNDLFGLMKTNTELLECFKKISEEGQGFVVKAQKSRNDTSLDFYSRYPKPTKPEDEYYLMLLKHEGHFNQTGITTLLRSEGKIFAGSLGRKTLATLLHLPVQPDLLREMLIGDLKNLSHLDQFMILVRSVAHMHQTVKYQITAESTTEGQKQRHNTNKFRQRYPWDAQTHKITVVNHHMLRQSESLGLGMLENAPKDMLLLTYSQIINKNIFEKMKDCREEYYSLLFDCLRFDQKSLKIEQKSTLASVFLDFVGMKIDEKRGEAEQFQKVFKYLLSFCFSEPVTEWKTKHRFVLLLHGLLTDANLMLELSSIEKQIISCPFDQILTVWYEHFLLDRMLEFKIKFEAKGVAFQEIQKIKENYLKLTSTLVNFTADQHQDHLHTKIVISMLQKALSLMTEIERQIKLICCPETRNKLIIVCAYEIISSAKKGDSLLCFGDLLCGLNQKVKHVLRVQCLTFVQKIVLNDLFQSLNTALEHRIYMLQIEEIINSSPILNTLIFREHLLRSQIQATMNKFADQPKRAYLRFFEEVTDACFEDKRIHLFQKCLCSCLRFIVILELDSVQTLSTFGRKFIVFLEEQQIKGDQLLQRQERQLLSMFLSDSPNCPEEVKRNLQRIASKQVFELQERRALSDRQWQIDDFNKVSLFSYIESSVQIGFSIAEYLKRIIRIFSAQILRNLVQIAYILSHVFLDSKQLKEIAESDELIYEEQVNNDRRHTRAEIRPNQFYEQMIVYRWKYFSAIHFMLAFFVPTLSDWNQHIEQTLKVLWRDSAGAAFTFLRQIIRVLNERPLPTNLTIFKINVGSFALQNQQFATYSVMKTYLGPTTLENRYQLICYTMSLIMDQKSNKLPILLEIATKIELLCPKVKTWIKEVYYPQFSKLFIKDLSSLRNVKKMRYINLKLSLFPGTTHREQLLFYVRTAFPSGMKKRRNGRFIGLLQDKLLRRLGESVGIKNYNTHDPDINYL